MKFVYSGIDMGNVILSEMNQTERNRHRMITPIFSILKNSIKQYPKMDMNVPVEYK